MPSRRRSRAYWENLVAEAERVGSVERVARCHRVVAKRIAWWRWWLRREKANGATRAKKTKTSAVKAKSPRLLPVVVAPMPSTAVGAVIEIAVADVKVRVDAGTEPNYVAALVEALRRC